MHRSIDVLPTMFHVATIRPEKSQVPTFPFTGRIFESFEGGLEVSSEPEVIP